MNNKQSRIEIKQNTKKNERMLDIGEHRGLPRRNATVAKMFIDCIMKIDAMVEVQDILEEEGIDTITFIERVVKQEVHRKRK